MNSLFTLEDNDYIFYLKNKIKNLKQEIDWLKNSLKNNSSSLLYSIKENPEFIDIPKYTENYFGQVIVCLFNEPDQDRRHFIGIARDEEKEQICYQYFINNNDYLDREYYKQILLCMHKDLIYEVMKDEV